MAQFLDYDWNSDEDFEESSLQGRAGLLFWSILELSYYKKTHINIMYLLLYVLKGIHTF